MHRFSGQAAFTLVEILVIVSVMGAIASLSLVSYGTWQRKSATNSVKSDIQQAVTGLTSYRAFNGSYSPNLAGTGFATSPSVATALYTNAPVVGMYQGLTTTENAQLLLNACNANLFSMPGNAACQFKGAGGTATISVKGPNDAETTWTSPLLQSALALNCPSQQASCDLARTAMINHFSAQGGTFPVTIPKASVPLPVPTQSQNGVADRYCFEARSANYPDIAFHYLSQSGRQAVGKCPSDPTLRYYP